MFKHFFLWIINNNKYIRLSYLFKTYQRRAIITVPSSQIDFFLQRKAGIILPPSQQYSRQFGIPKCSSQMQYCWTVFSWFCGKTFWSSSWTCAKGTAEVYETLFKFWIGVELDVFNLKKFSESGLLMLINKCGWGKKEPPSNVVLFVFPVRLPHPGQQLENILRRLTNPFASKFWTVI